MGQFIQKIALFVLTLMLYGCDFHKIESFEYTFYAFEGETPREYATILRQKNRNTIKQIRYSGGLNYNFGTNNPYCQGFQYCQGFYPDSSHAGFSNEAQFNYRRWGGFNRYEFDSDTISTCVCFNVPIPLTINAWKDLRDNADRSGECLDLKRRSNDTLIGNILPVEEYVEFNYYMCWDTTQIDQFWRILIDTKRFILVGFLSQPSHHEIDAYGYEYKIVNTKSVPNSYFNELWEKAQVDTFFNCSPFLD